MRNSVEVRCVAKTYKRRQLEVRALDGVSMTLAEGEFVSIMGPSGSGKSTLLHLLGALDRPTSGEILIEGRAIGGLSDNELSDLRRERIGFVFQHFNLLPTLSAYENAALPMLLTGRTSEADRDRVLETLAAVGMDDRLDHKPEELSGGEIQRVAIARALALRPAIILADEPTGNLDTHTGDEILTLLRECQREFGQTIVMVTHNGKAAECGDRVIELRDGGVVSESSRQVADLSSAVPGVAEEL